MTDVRGLTVALRVGDTAEALRFYGLLLGRGPDYSPHDDFHEWQLSPRGWLQLATEEPDPQPSRARIRFDVPDVRVAARRLREHGIAVEEPTMLPGVVIFTNLTDPWNNPLGLYQDLSPDAPPPVPGGSTRDPSLFVKAGD